MASFSLLLGDIGFRQNIFINSVDEAGGSLALSDNEVAFVVPAVLQNSSRIE